MPEAIICGAGILGVSAAHALSSAGLRDILLIDERPPLTLTSDHSTECYRNWWPDAAMLGLMNRSIDLMESLAGEGGNIFRMNRRGYLYTTARESGLAALRARAARISDIGGGPIRIHSRPHSGYQPAAPEGFDESQLGADLFLGHDAVHEHFPYLTERVVGALHVRRAGWLSAQQLGMHLLQAARRRGVRFESAQVRGVDTEGGRVHGVILSDGRRLDCPIFVNAAGPFLRPVANLLGMDLPVVTELHLKASFNDHLRVVGRSAPLLIWEDPQALPWGPDEGEALAADPETRWLTEVFPAGAHLRPEGAGESQTVLMLWDYRTSRIEPVFPAPLEAHYPELVLRGLSGMIPGLKAYFTKLPRCQLDGGYYTRTPENRLLAGRLPLEGAYVIGAASGHGIMAACAAGELLALHILGGRLPDYAQDFSPARYEDEGYLRRLEQESESGQL